MNYSSRLEQLRKALPVPAILISSPANIQYLTGFSGSSSLLVVTKERALFFTDFRYEQRAQKLPKDFDVHIVKKSLWQDCCTLIKDLRIEELAFESQDLTHHSYQKLARELKSIDLEPATGIVEKLRMVKDEDELALLKKAADSVSRCFTYAYSILKAGISEKEVAWLIEQEMHRLGADRPSFPIIVASGENAAMPHAESSSRVIQKGDLVVLDMGVVVDGYCSDCTRTVAIGKADKKQQEVFRVVREAQQHALDCIKEGEKARDIDQKARRHIKVAGFGEAFGHALGHGIGLEIHESPTLSPHSDDVLKTGVVITVEPGIYLPDWGGVRIEDSVIVTESGREIITTVENPEELLVI